MSKILSKTAPMAKLAGATVALSLAAALAGCTASQMNGSVDSVHQPVVERTNYALDLTTGPGGLSLPEERRLEGWFDAMDLRYGDRIAIDDPLESPATRAAISAVAGRHGMLLANEAPVTQGYVNAGSVRVIVSRSIASVPGCPDWSRKTDTNFGSAASTNYGCAVNSNIAAMVADPEHLVRGASNTGDTTVMSSDKAIKAFRDKAVTGGELKATGTK